MNSEFEEKLNEAVLLHESGKVNEAQAMYKELLHKMPNNDLVLAGLGLISIDKNEPEKAIGYLNRAIEVSQNPVYYVSLGNIFSRQKNYDRAEECYLKVLETYPDNIEALYNLGIVYLTDFRLDDAKPYFERVMALNPEIAECHFQLAFIYSEISEHDKAIKYLVKAIELKPNYAKAMFLLGCIFLKMGNFAEGWKLYESRFYTKDGVSLINSSKPLWDGASLNGKTIYIQQEQGYGDGIMFARYIPVLNSMGAKILLKTQEALKQLFKDSSLPAVIIDNSTPLEKLEFDTHISLMSLPSVLKANENSIPFRDKYLKANPDKIRQYKEKYFNNDNYKIGIVWQCNDISRGDRLKFIPDISYLYPILQIPEVKVYSLQKGKGEEQLKNLPDNINITALGHTFNDFSDTAGAIENLDLVISVDTSIVHLSGALGKDTWFF